MTEELHALAGAYALDALGPVEREIFEEHLAGCQNCADEVAGWQNAAAELSHISATPAPPELRTAVLAGIAQLRPLPPLTTTVVALRRPRTSALNWQLLAAACALIAVLATGWGLRQRHQTSSTVAQTSLSKVLAAHDSQAVVGNIGGDSQVTMLYSKSVGRMVLFGHGVSDLDSTKTYQAWTISAAGTATSAGLFRPNAQGDFTFSAAGDLADTAVVGVTIEPAGGSRKPTSTPVGSGLKLRPA
jgi:anti-sigma-K factor RskA